MLLGLTGAPPDWTSTALPPLLTALTCARDGQKWETMRGSYTSYILQTDARTRTIDEDLRLQYSAYLYHRRGVMRYSRGCDGRVTSPLQPADLLTQSAQEFPENRLEDSWFIVFSHHMVRVPSACATGKGVNTKVILT